MPGAAFVLVLALAGCAAGPAARPRQGPDVAAPLSLEPGTYDGRPARRVVSAHYLIETTIDDADFVASLGQLMEGALGQYRRVAPAVAMTDRPMVCHIFENRRHWAEYTRANAGEDADIYLQINRGGYTAGDRYVAYYIGDVGTWSVAAHEGWHQFVARHFKRRPPPFLEEGLACLFEDVTWDAGRPRWDLSANGQRDAGLRKTVGRAGLIPLAQLCTMHAGQVVNAGGGRIDGFYAQNWAFALFLWEAEGGRYRPALQRMLKELAAGEAPGGEKAGADPDGTWDPSTAKPLLEHYLGNDIAAIDREYRAFLVRLVAKRTEPDRAD